MTIFEAQFEQFERCTQSRRQTNTHLLRAIIFVQHFIFVYEPFTIEPSANDIQATGDIKVTESTVCEIWPADDLMLNGKERERIARRKGICRFRFIKEVDATLYWRQLVTLSGQH